MMHVINKIIPYKINGEDREIDGPSLKVNSTWPQEDLVELEFEGLKIVVSGNDLKKAIDNSRNS